MSHDFAMLLSEGWIHRGNYKDEPEDVHMTLHSFSGGIANGRSVSLLIDSGHTEGASAFGANIKLSEEGVMALLMVLQKWLAHREEDGDRGEVDKFNCNWKTYEEYKQMKLEAEYKQWKEEREGIERDMWFAQRQEKENDTT